MEVEHGCTKEYVEGGLVDFQLELPKDQLACILTKRLRRPSVEKLAESNVSKGV